MEREHICCNKQQVKRGHWSSEEDEKLKVFVKKHGEYDWSYASELTGLKRCGQSCRLRWRNYLKPNLKHGNFTAAECDLIFTLHKSVGNKWEEIARMLPRRTGNEIRNFWNSKLKKKSLRVEGVIISNPPTLPKLTNQIPPPHFNPPTLNPTFFTGNHHSPNPPKIFSQTHLNHLFLPQPEASYKLANSTLQPNPQWRESYPLKPSNPHATREPSPKLAPSTLTYNAQREKSTPNVIHPISILESSSTSNKKVFHPISITDNQSSKDDSSKIILNYSSSATRSFQPIVEYQSSTDCNLDSHLESVYGLTNYRGSHPLSSLSVSPSHGYEQLSSTSLDNHHKILSPIINTPSISQCELLGSTQSYDLRQLPLCIPSTPLTPNYERMILSHSHDHKNLSSQIINTSSMPKYEHMSSSYSKDNGLIPSRLNSSSFSSFSPIIPNSSSVYDINPCLSYELRRSGLSNTQELFSSPMVDISSIPSSQCMNSNLSYDNTHRRLPMVIPACGIASDGKFSY